MAFFVVVTLISASVMAAAAYVTVIPSEKLNE